MSEKRKLPVIGILCILLVAGLSVCAQKVNTVVLDAGHGGHDTGALGKHSREKDITLAIVLKLRNYVRDNLKDVKVILTRDNDEFVELYRRARIANENNADLFISVHCNANPSSTPFGTETYVMGLHKSNANLSVAKAENAAILLEDDYVEQYDGFDPNSPEGNIFFSIMQNSFLDKSLDFAGRVERQFRDKLYLFDRGVKQAGFLVLYKTAMPGVLVETGFISNAKDEKFLLSDKGQDQMAQAIFKALREYKYSVEKRDLSLLKEPDSLFQATVTYEKPGNNNQMDGQATSDQGAPILVETENEQVWFRVQFIVSPDDKPENAPEFRNLPDVGKYFQNGLYKYTSGNFTTFKEASAFRVEVAQKGFRDAFVVSFYHGKRITIDEARRLMGN